MFFSSDKSTIYSSEKDKNEMALTREKIRLLLDELEGQAKKVGELESDWLPVPESNFRRIDQIKHELLSLGVDEESDLPDSNYEKQEELEEEGTISFWLYNHELQDKLKQFEPDAWIEVDQNAKLVVCHEDRDSWHVIDMLDGSVVECAEISNVTGSTNEATKI